MWWPRWNERWTCTTSYNIATFSLTSPVSINRVLHGFALWPCEIEPKIDVVLRWSDIFCRQRQDMQSTVGILQLGLAFMCIYIYCIIIWRWSFIPTTIIVSLFVPQGWILDQYGSTWINMDHCMIMVCWCLLLMRSIHGKWSPHCAPGLCQKLQQLHWCLQPRVRR